MKFLLPVIIMTIMCGCSQTHSVSRGEPYMWLPEARRDLVQKEATVTTTNGRSLHGTVVALSEDSVLVRDGATETAMSLLSVTSIGTPGSMIAPVLGVLGGAALGGAIGYATAGEGPPYAILHGVGETIAGGFFGGFVGGLLAAHATEGDIYELPGMAGEIRGKGSRGSESFSFDVTIEISGKAVGTFFTKAPGLPESKGTVHCGSVNGSIGVFGGVIDGTANSFTIMVNDEHDGIIIGIGQPDCNTSGFLTPVPITEGEIMIIHR
jgi:hypothetical protein